MTFDPVFGKDGKWYFWTETWADSIGPYESEEEARKALEEYCKELNYEGIKNSK